MAGWQLCRRLASAAALADAGDWAAARTPTPRCSALGGVGRRPSGSRPGVLVAGRPPGGARARRAGVRGATRRSRGTRTGAMVGVHLCIWYLDQLRQLRGGRGLAGPGAPSGGEQRGRRGRWVGHPGVGLRRRRPGRGPPPLRVRGIERRGTVDRDLATMALADLGLWHVSAGEIDRGMAMLDEAMASDVRGAASDAGGRGVVQLQHAGGVQLGGRPAACDGWCRAADRFMETYGCPFLQARCRAHYGRVLVATGHWDQAERELAQALSMSADTGSGPRTGGTDRAGRAAASVGGP